MLMKSPLTPAGIEPATFRFVAQHLNHCATGVTSRVKIFIFYLLKDNSAPWSYLCINLAYLCAMLIFCTGWVSEIYKSRYLCGPEEHAVAVLCWLVATFVKDGSIEDIAN